MNFKILGGRTSTLFVSLLLTAGVTACTPGAVAISPTAVPTAAVVVSTSVVTQATRTSAPTAMSTAPSTATPIAAPTAAAVAGATPSTQAAPASTTATGQDAAKTAAVKINLNTAPNADFLKAPGVGNNMVREFLEYRPWVSVQQFSREIGKYVAAAQVTEYLKYLYVPIAVNEADAATLQQIPGVDAKTASALIAARPYASNDAFLTKLAEYLSPAQVAAAKSYLSNP